MGKLVHSNVYYHPMQLTNYLRADYYSFLQSDHQCLVQWVFVFVKSTHLSKECKGNEDRKKRRGNQTWVIYSLNYCSDKPKPNYFGQTFFSTDYCFYNYCTRTIIGRSWLGAALEYKPYIRIEFSEKSSLKTKKWFLKMG